MPKTKQKECIYCDHKSPEAARYCIHCGMPFEEGEIPVVPGDVFQKDPPPIGLAFDTTLPFDLDEL